MSLVKSVVVEAVSTKPGCVLLKMLDENGTIEGEVLMNLGMAQRICKDLEENVRIAKNLQNTLQVSLSRDSMIGGYKNV